MREPDETLPPPVAEPEEGVLRRWSRRKARARADTPTQIEDTVTTEAASGCEPVPPQTPPDALTDADMPSLESLDEDSDYSGFMSPGVSEELRQLALHRLFHLPKFNVCDGLDDYDDDFRGFAALGDVITADLSHRMEHAAETAKAQVRAASPGDAGEVAAPDTMAANGGEEEPQEPLAPTTGEPDPPGEPPQGVS
jgi:hypothetical protein